MSQTPAPTQTLSPTDTGRRPVRVRTVVFGLVALAVAVTALLATLTDVRVNATALTFAVLIGAGALLLGAGVLAAVREANGGPGGSR